MKKYAKYILMILIFPILMGCKPPEDFGPGIPVGDPIYKYKSDFILDNELNIRQAAVCASVEDSFQPEDCSFRPAGTVAAAVMANISNKTQQIFNSVVTNNSYRNVVTIAGTLFVIFFGMGIITGLVQASSYEFIIRVIKITLVIALTISPGAWAFFNNTVVMSFESLISGIAGAFNDAFSPLDPGNLAPTCAPPVVPANASIVDLSARLFWNVDLAINTLMGGPSWRLFMALMLTFPDGLVIGLLFAVVAFTYTVAIVKALYIFLMAFIARVLLFSLAPIFLIFVLFDQTRSLFDGWLKQIINYSLQPIFVFAYLAFFNGIIVSMIIGGLGGENTFVCYWEVARIDYGQLIANLVTLQPLRDFLGQVATAAGNGFDIFINFIPGLRSAIDTALTPFSTSLTDIKNEIIRLINDVMTNPPLIGGFRDAIANTLGRFSFHWWSIFTLDTSNAADAQLLNLYNNDINNANMFFRENPHEVEGAVLNDPIPMSTGDFFVILITAIIMMKMAGWAQSLAQQISEGIAGTPGAAPGAGQVAQTGAGILGGIGRLGYRAMRLGRGRSSGATEGATVKRKGVAEQRQRAQTAEDIARKAYEKAERKKAELKETADKLNDALKKDDKP